MFPEIDTSRELYECINVASGLLIKLYEYTPGLAKKFISFGTGFHRHSIDKSIPARGLKKLI